MFCLKFKLIQNEIEPITKQTISNNKKTAVYKCTRGSETYVIKSFAKKQNYDKEILIYETLGSHPNIVKYIKYTDRTRELKLEWAPKGTLYDDIVNNPRQRSRVTLERVTMAKQILSALIYLHSFRLIHRDIKPENVFIFNDVVKLADFDLSLILEEGKTKHSDPHTIGTPLYLAPESVGPVISQGFAEYSAASDLWQFGLVLVNLIGRVSAYPNRDMDLLKTKMNEFYIHLRLTIVWPNAKWINEGPVRELALSIFQLNPAMRPSTTEAMDILEKEEKRLSALK